MEIRATQWKEKLLAVLAFAVIAFVGIVVECIVIASPVIVSANWLAFFCSVQAGLLSI